MKTIPLPNDLTTIDYAAVVRAHQRRIRRRQLSALDRKESRLTTIAVLAAVIATVSLVHLLSMLAA